MLTGKETTSQLVRLQRLFDSFVPKLGITADSLQDISSPRADPSFAVAKQSACVFDQ